MPFTRLHGDGPSTLSGLATLTDTTGRAVARNAFAVATATDLPRAQVEATLSATHSEVRDAVASGDKVQLPATRVVGFKVGTPFKQEVADSTTTKATAKKATKK
ncbi:hypothetical protein RHODO2019_06450 [Rhodococcus antarcticus]|jgi:nucleoid DNA-binding protein|uniref:DNA-binding protein HU-beta n=1 Tax=Rhodococcus antarcticus TaxID=2987751 RepID=A0ABY6P340_9NOCA|nr:hypothetical protein [Rhodococcus antarcticus]UZJ26067.1 hypothetical protein RHODO2019_06450 [Rhodococcus antarcticus]